MRVIILGAAGFIGTNLSLSLSKAKDLELTLVDRSSEYFNTIKSLNIKANIIVSDFSENTDFDSMLRGQEVVYHLVSTTVPTTSNQHITEELKANVIFTSNMLDACVRVGIKKVVFISSGGTVYGKEENCPLKENTATNPITSYGVQKVTIEKLLYLYHYLYHLDYRVIRLANPYGPYQRPNGILGAVTTFTYKALINEPITVFGDGSVVRDFIYIDDAIRGIINIVNGENKHRTFNLGCGYGTSINKVIDIIKDEINADVKIVYKEARKVDVPVNYLDISRYEKAYGSLDPICLSEGIRNTAEFLKNYQ